MAVEKNERIKTKEWIYYTREKKKSYELIQLMNWNNKK